MALTIKEKIKLYLVQFPNLRENKLNLTRAIWEDECKLHGIEPPSEFMDLLLSGKLSHPETIRRSAMKCVEENPELAPSTQTQIKNKELEVRIRGGKGELLK